MKRITSRDNAIFKSLRLLAQDSSLRKQAGVVLIEGVHLCDSYLQSGGSPHQIVVGSSALVLPEVVDLLARCCDDGPSAPRFAFDDALFGAISGLASGPPILMVVACPRPVPPDRVTATSVLLDRIQDPGNVGSILRSAAAAGIADVYLSGGCAGAWSSKVMRAGMGAHFHLHLFEDCDLSAIRMRIDIPWTATSPHAGQSLFDADLRGERVWVFGHEGQGLDDALMDGASTVRIPQPGSGESLNVAASAAICFFEQVRQRASG